MITIEGREIPWRPGMTLAQAVATLAAADLCAVVRLNGRLVSRPDFDATPVPDGARIDPLPLIAGG